MPSSGEALCTGGEPGWRCAVQGVDGVFERGLRLDGRARLAATSFAKGVTPMDFQRESCALSASRATVWNRPLDIAAVRAVHPPDDGARMSDAIGGIPAGVSR